MKLKIITYPNPILGQKSKKITRVDESLRKLAEDMTETVQNYGSEHETGVAIAAIQVGVPLRMTVVRHDDGCYYPLINPQIVKASKETETDMEGCLSVPQKYGKVTRPKKVKIKGTDLDGRKVEIKAEGLMARVYQHEIDHMDGKLFISKVQDEKIYKLDESGELRPL